jgi:uncharacterized protein DUF5658
MSVTPPIAAALRFAAATAVFWVSLTMAVEGRTGAIEELAPPPPAFQDVAADHAGAPAVLVASTREALPDRPAVLTPLYVSFAALQLLDIHSTLRAPDFGAREANPLVTGLLASPAAFVATKAVVTTSLIYMSERLRRRHPRTAQLHHRSPRWNSVAGGAFFRP